MNARLPAIAISFVLCIVASIPPAEAKRSDAMLADLTVRGLAYVRTSDEIATLQFRVANVGRSSATKWFAIAVFVDGKPVAHTLYNQQKEGTAARDADAVIPLAPKGVYSTEIGNYHSLRTGFHTIKVCADKLMPSRIDKNPLYEGFHNNMVIEQNEHNNCQSLSLAEGDMQ